MDLGDNIQPVDKAADVLQLEDEAQVKVVREFVQKGKQDFELPAEFSAMTAEKNLLRTVGVVVLSIGGAALIGWMGAWIMAGILLVVGVGWAWSDHHSGAAAAEQKLQVRATRDRLIVSTKDGPTLDSPWEELLVARMGFVEVNKAQMLENIGLISFGGQAAHIEFRSFDDDSALRGTVLRKLLDAHRLHLKG